MLNKIKINRVFQLDSGSDRIYYKFDGKKTFVLSLYFNGNKEWIVDCTVEKCLCPDKECCILRNPIYSEDIRYLTKKDYNKYLDQDDKIIRWLLSHV